MISLPELHTIINSLNKPEKRFFKLLSATEGSNIDKALALFDFIERVNEKEDVLAKAKKVSRIDISAGNMNVLFELILKSQRNFYSETITGFAITDEIANLKILVEKAQHKQCRKMLKKVKGNAIANEKFSTLLHILDLEKQLLATELLEKSYKEEYEKLNRERDKFIELEKNISAYYSLYARLRYELKNSRITERKNEQKFYRDLLKDPLIKNPALALCKKSLFLLHKCRSLCYGALGEQQLKITQLLDLKVFMQKHDLIFNEMPRQYLDVLFNLGNCHIDQKKPHLAKNVLSEMILLLNSKKVTATDLEIKLRAYIYILELLILTSAGKLTNAGELAETILEFLNKNEAVVNREDKAILLFNLTSFNIYKGDYKRADETLDMLRKQGDRNSRQDIISYSLMQELIIRFELKEYSKLQLVHSALNTLIKQDVFKHPTEIKFIRFFNNITSKTTSIPSSGNFLNLYKEIHKQLPAQNTTTSLFFYYQAYISCKAGHGTMQEFLSSQFKS